MKRAIILLMACLTSGMLLGNHWTPESASYSETMTLYAVIQINGVEQYSDQLEVGVFCGDECRGTAVASEFFITNRFLVILSIYGEIGHQLTFKLYDHGTEQELNLASPDAVTFIQDGYGNPIEPYVLNYTGGASSQSSALAEGWNWWSPMVETTLGQLEEALGGNGLSIKGPNASASYGNGQWTGTLEGISAGMMYKIKTSASLSLTLTGVMPASATVTLAPGYNWFGYTGQEAVTLATAFASFTPTTGDKVVSQDAGFAIYNGTAWEGTLPNLNPGHGYVYVSRGNTTQTVVFGPQLP